MTSFLNLLRGPQAAFVPEREVRHLSTRSARLTDRDIRTGLRFPEMLPASPYKTAEIKRLEARINHLEGELLKIEELVAAGKEVVSEHKGTIKSLHKSIKDLTAKKDLAETKAKDFKTDLDAARKEKEQLEAKRNKLEKYLDASQRREASLQGELSKADADWQQRIQELEDTLAATQADNIALKAEIALKDELIEEEQAKYHNAMALLVAEQEKTQSLEARVVQLQELLAAQTAKHAKHIDTLKDSRDTHKRGEENERKASLAAQAERDAIRDERDKALARVAELEGLTSDQQTRISSLEESLGAERARGDNLVCEMAQLRQQLQHVADALGKANEELHSALQTKKLLSKDLKAAQKALDDISAKVVVATSTDEQLQERVVLAEKGNREQQTSQRAVETTLFDFVKRYDAVTSELARLRIASAPSSPVPSSPLPLGNAVPFDIAPQLEAGSPPAKRRSFFGFFGKQADNDSKVSSPALA